MQPMQPMQQQPQQQALPYMTNDPNHPMLNGIMHPNAPGFAEHGVEDDDEHEHEHM